MSKHGRVLRVCTLLLGLTLTFWSLNAQNDRGVITGT